MNNKNKHSLHYRLLRLLLMTISLIIILSSFAFIYTSGLFIKTIDQQQIERILNQLYNSSVVDAKTLSILDASELSENFEYYKTVDSTATIYNNLRLTYPNKIFWLLDSQQNIIEGSSSYKLNSTMINKIMNHTYDAWIDGNEQFGIYSFYGIRLKSSNASDIAYIITAVEVSNKQFVQRIKDSFNIDASIFYKDVRLITTVENNDQSLNHTLLDPSVYHRFQNGAAMYIGRSNVEDIPYLAAYRSFSNNDGQLVGLVAVGKSLDSYNLFIIKLILGVFVMGILLLMFTTKVSYTWMKKNITDPLKNATSGLIYIAQGGNDYHQYFATKNRFDEFSQLNTAIESLVEEIETSNKKIEKIAYFDALTHLPNRYHLYKRWSTDQYQRSKASIHRKYWYLLYIDIDKLRMVNDLLGHAIGDRLIIGIGESIKLTIDNDPLFEVYHFGGGQYVVFCEVDYDQNYIQEFASRLAKSFDAPYYFDSNVVNISLTIGIAFANANSIPIELLVQQAEIAMHQIKKEGTAPYAFYSDEMIAALIEQSNFEDDLKSALANNEFYLVFQPKLNLQNNSATKFEALIRWKHPIRGIVSPLEFIEVAENIGLIVPLGQWVIEQSCAFINRVKAETDIDITISVNVSPLQVLKDDFVKNVLTTLIVYKLQPHNLELEITETVFMEYLTASVEKLRQLSALGVDIAIDDFGKGYSSLAYLRHLPITVLKIDKMFIDDILESEDCLVDNIIDIGHHMHLKVVAEGVETQKQIDYLKRSNCDFIQGYFYSRPLSEDDTITFIKEDKLRGDKQ